MSVLQHGSTYGIQVTAPCNGAALSLHAPGEALPWHEHEGAYVCVVMSGTFQESAGSHDAERRTGHIVLHPAGARHADRFGTDGGRCLNLHVASNRIARPEVRRGTAACRAAALELAVQSALGPAGDALTAEAALAKILDLLFNAKPSRTRVPVARVVEALDDEPHRQWTLTELARIADRHPTHLARTFREATGCSIGEYRRQRRLIALALSLRCTGIACSPCAGSRLHRSITHDEGISQGCRLFPRGLAPPPALISCNKCPEPCGTMRA
jgi:AraC family transcriptional regulator